MTHHHAAAPPLARDAVGVGLRPQHYPWLFDHDTRPDYFEIISENFITPAAPPRAALMRIAATTPIVLHGVGLNLLGHEPLDEHYLDQIARLADDLNAPFVTDHLCFTRSHAHNLHDLLPTPYTPDIADYAAERAAHVARRIGRPFALENLSSYVTFRDSTLTEWQFYTRVVRDADISFMFDINNVYVSATNHGFDPQDYLAAIDYTRVLQVHLAGHERLPNGTLIDTHNDNVCDAVWQLYRNAWNIGGPFPTLIEWDDRIPPFPALLAEANRAREVRK